MFFSKQFVCVICDFGSILCNIRVCLVLVEDQVEMIEVLDLVIEMTDHEKCLTQNAEIVEMIVKYHLDQRKIDLYIAENASKNTDNINKFFEKNTQNFVTFIRINNYKLTQSLMIK